MPRASVSYSLRSFSGRNRGAQRTSTPPTFIWPSALSFRSPLVDRHMPYTRSSEGLALPAAPATPQTHPGELSHQVEFGGPKVTKLRRIESDALLGDLNMLMHRELPD